MVKLRTRKGVGMGEEAPSMRGRNSHPYREGPRGPQGANRHPAALTAGIEGTIISSTTVGLMALSDKMEVLLANPAFHQVSGLSREEVQGKRLSEIPRLQGLAQLASGLLLADETRLSSELVYDHPETGLRQLTVSSSRLGGDEQAVLMSIEDVTDQRQAQDRVRDASQLLMLGELVAGVAHQLNNPLAVVLGFAQLLEAQELGSTAKEDVQKILSQTQRAIDTVQQLLSFEPVSEV